MPAVIVTDREGQTRPIDFTPGVTLMQTLCEGGVDELLAICGGVCSCATCHVFIDSQSMPALAPISEDEDDLLEGSPHRTEHSRLSCQIRLEADHDQLRVTIAPED